jgi:HEPN domain-containing protein
MRPDAREEGRRWLAQAEHDLAFAELAARERYFNHACFQSQQAAEKALKAFLYGHGAEHVFGHSVGELVEACARIDGQFVALRPRVSPLDQFYLTARYPNSLPGGIPAEAFNRDDAVRALGMAGEVLALVKGRLG